MQSQLNFMMHCKVLWLNFIDYAGSILYLVLFYVSYILSEILRVYRQYSLVYQFDSST